MLAKIAVAVLAIVAGVSAGVAPPPIPPPTISGQPVLRFLCPLKDKSGYDLGVVNYSYSNTAYFCSYPAEAGQDPFAYYCLYDAKKGGLVEDHNVSLCPKAGYLGPVPRKRSTLPVHPQIHERDMSDAMKKMRAVKRTGQKQRMSEAVKRV